MGAALGGEDHDHPFALKLGLALRFGNFGEVGFEMFHERAAEVDVLHLAAAEHDVELNLVPLAQEFFGLVELGGLIVVVDADGLDAQFFELRDVGGVGLLFFFLLLIFPFAVVHDAADRGLLHGGDFDQVESHFSRHAQGFHGRDNADLLVLIVNETNGRNADLFVASQTVLANGVDSLKAKAAPTDEGRADGPF